MGEKAVPAEPPIDGPLPDFQTMCRICARVDAALRPIRQDTADDDMAAYIKKYLHIEVQLTDSRLPPNICAECCRCLLAIHQLYTKCTMLNELWTAQLSSATFCPFCTQFAAGSKALVQAHMRSQHSDQIFHCDVCAQLVDRRLLMEHMTEHARSLEQNLDDEGPVDDVDKSGEPWNQQPQQADATNKSPTAKPSKPKTQPTDKSNIDTPTTIASPHATAFGCPDCERSFATPSGRRYHQQSVHQALRRFRCERCPAAFASKRVLTNHMLGRHASERSFSCGQCPKAFKTDNALWTHRRRLHATADAEEGMHGGPGATAAFDGACDTCGKRFRSRGEMVRHLASHSGARKHACPYCSKRFAVRNNLTKHLRTHTALTKEYRCHICAYAGAQRRYLAGHMLSVHQTVLRPK